MVNSRTKRWAVPGWMKRREELDRARLPKVTTPGIAVRDGTTITMHGETHDVIWLDETVELPKDYWKNYESKTCGYFDDAAKLVENTVEEWAAKRLEHMKDKRMVIMAGRRSGKTFTWGGTDSEGIRPPEKFWVNGDGFVTPGVGPAKPTYPQETVMTEGSMVGSW